MQAPALDAGGDHEAAEEEEVGRSRRRGRRRRGSRLMPSSGNAKTGTSAVAAIGIASLIHHTAMSAVTAAVRRPASDMPSGSGSRMTDEGRADARPTRPIDGSERTVARVLKAEPR